MRVVIVGAGAIGSVIGGFLAKSGHTVAMVARGAHLHAMAENGLRITGIWGDHDVAGFSTYGHARDVPGDDWDLVAVVTKSFDTAGALDDAAGLVGDNTLVLSVQNGLGNIEQVESRFGVARSLGGMVIFGVRVVEPGTVEVTVFAHEGRIGSMTGAIDPDRIEMIAETFTAAGIPMLATDDIESHVWGKVLYNCALNPLSAVLGVTYGTLAERQHTCEIMSAVVDEIYRVAETRGVALFEKTASDYFRHFLEDLVPPTAAHRASMYEDLRIGRRTEIDALNGAVVGLGAEHGVGCPVNAALTALVHARERAQELDRV